MLGFPCVIGWQIYPLGVTGERRNGLKQTENRLMRMACVNVPTAVDVPTLSTEQLHQHSQTTVTNFIDTRSSCQRQSDLGGQHQDRDRSPVTRSSDQLQAVHGRDKQHTHSSTRPQVLHRAARQFSDQHSTSRPAATKQGTCLSSSTEKKAAAMCTQGCIQRIPLRASTNP